MNIFANATLSTHLMQQYRSYLKGEYAGKPQQETWRVLQEAVTLPGVGNKALELVSTLQKSQSLTLVSENLSVLGPLSHMKRLEKLEIKNNKNDLDPKDDRNYSRGILKIITALSELTELRQLKIVNQVVASVKPLEDLSLLRYLNLEGNAIKSIEALAGLPGITRLNLANNEFEDLSPLARMLNMEYLYLSENQIKDISPLADMDGLQVLLFDHNLVVNISGLARLNSLKFVTFNDNLIDALDVLKELPNLSDLLSQWKKTDFNEFRDTSSAVSKLAHRFATRFPGPYLDCLDLSGNRLQHLGDEWLDNEIFEPLRTLKVSRNMISNLNGFHLRNIINLQLGHNHLSILDQLQYLITLQVLNLQGNEIEDIAPLRYLSKDLRSLDLSENNIEDIEPLAELTNLTEIDLHGNRIKNINALCMLSKVLSMPLQNNCIKNLRPLKHLRQLQSLNLGYNKIKDLKGIGGLTNLQSLNLERNKILEIEAIANLQKLTYVNLKFNRIRDVRPASHVKLILIGEQRPPGTTSTKAVDNAEEARAVDPGKNGKGPLAVAEVLAESAVEGQEESDNESTRDSSDDEESDDESPKTEKELFVAVESGISPGKFGSMLKKASTAKLSQQTYVDGKLRYVWDYAAHLGQIELLELLFKDSRVAQKLTSKRLGALRRKATKARDELRAQQGNE